MSSASVLQVFVFRDGEYVGSEVFVEPEIMVGRGQDVDLYLDDEMVAPSHAILTHENEQATVLDLGAPGGVQVNRAPIQHSYVTPRDEIRIGRHTLKIKFAAAKRSLRPAPAPQPSAPPSQQHFADDLHTEVFDSQSQRSPVQRNVPTDIVRDRAAEASIDALLEDELKGDFDEITASIAISGSDVVSASNLRTPDAPAKPYEDQETVAFDSGAPRGHTQPPRRQRAEAVEDVAELNSALDSAFVSDAFERPASRAPSPVAPSRSQPIARITSTPAPSRPEARASSHPDPLATRSSRPSQPEPQASHPSQPEPQATVPSRPERVAQEDPAAAFSGLGAGPAPDPVDYDGELDEDDLDELTRPGFSLVTTLVESSGQVPQGDLAVEVIAFAQDEVRHTRLLEKSGDRYVLGKGRAGDFAPAAGHTGVKLARKSGEREAILEFPSDAEGAIVEGSRRIDLDQLKVPKNAVSKTGNLFHMALRPGMTATFRIGDNGFHVRFVAPPKLAATVGKMQMDKNVLSA
ncbi:MAG: FHA domain-containing protein, partial [Deltaproteobacteria bacterium]